MGAGAYKLGTGSMRKLYTDGISKSYKGRQVVHSVSVQVSEGERERQASAQQAAQKAAQKSDK